jgi:hypothetical protein
MSSENSFDRSEMLSPIEGKTPAEGGQVRKFNRREKRERFAGANRWHCAVQ